MTIQSNKDANAAAAQATSQGSISPHGLKGRSRREPSWRPTTASGSIQDHSAVPVRNVDSVTSMDMAARLISEAAHDVRSPLTGVREAIRLVSSGELGPLNQTQQTLLNDAGSQCDSIHNLIDNMLHFDRLRSGIPATERHWLLPNDFPEQVSRTIDPIAAARRVAVRWDGFDGSLGPVFGDSDLLRRFLINLVGNAITVSEERTTVVVQLKPAITRGMVRLSVIDSGPGMTKEKIEKLAVRGQSETGGTGLGLAIARSLAALHFARLLIMSTPGVGTRVGIDLPAAGPTSVADAFARWRESVTPPRGTLLNQNAIKPAKAASSDFRVDHAETLGRTVLKNEAVIGFDGMPPRFPFETSMVTIRLSPKSSHAASDAVDTLLQADQQLHELAYRTSARRWVLLWDNSLEEALRRRAAIDRRLCEVVEGSDVQWGEPMLHSVGSLGNRGHIRELLVRDSLHASSRLPLLDDRLQCKSMNTLQSEEVALRRLNEEMLRLSQLLNRQSDRLQKQAHRYERIVD